MSSEQAPVQAKSRMRAVALRIVLYVLVCYVGFAIFMISMEHKLLYHPFSAQALWSDPLPAPAMQESTVTDSAGARIHLRWSPKPVSANALLWCYGNAGNMCLALPPDRVRTWQDELDVSILQFDYPGYGKSEGSASESGLYAAADAALKWLGDAQKIPSVSTVIFGQSLGSGVAVDLAARNPCRALVLLSPFTSTPDVAQDMYKILPAKLLMRNRFDSLSKIGSCQAPVFIAHGTCDQLVSFSQGQKLHEAAGTPKEFYAMEGCNHDGPFASDLLPRIRAFLLATTSHAPLRK